MEMLRMKLRTVAVLCVLSPHHWQKWGRLVATLYWKRPFCIEVVSTVFTELTERHDGITRIRERRIKALLTPPISGRFVLGHFAMAFPGPEFFAQAASAEPQAAPQPGA